MAIKKSTLRFLRNLSKNNDRTWFKANRAAYDAAHENVLDVVEALIVGLSKFDPPIIQAVPEACLFRIYRDARFSKDKTPYKTNMGAFITEEGRKLTRAGYYLHVDPTGSFLAGGLYRPPSKELNRVRQAIDDDAQPLRKILKKKKFSTLFGETLPGDRVKTAPRGYAKDHQEIDLLQLKSFEVMTPVKASTLTSPSFVKEAMKVFKVMAPLNGYLNQTLARR